VITLAPTEIDRTTALAAAPSIRSWLADGKDLDLAGTWPQVWGPHGSARHFAVLDSGRIVSHAAVRPARLTVVGGEITAWLIGSVATAPTARGQGCASAVLDKIEEEARAAGADALLLWSAHWDFYLQRGFRPASAQLEITVTPPALYFPDIRPASASDLVALLDWHERKLLRVRRTLGDMAILLSAHPMQTFVRERHGRISAHACLGKGSDFPGWWHEVGGSDQEVAALVLSATSQLRLANASVVVPPYRPRLAELLLPHSVQSCDGFGGLRCPLTPEGAAAFWIDGLDSI
jgi:GNAT superfamily N-acetyltransferase